jgi:hypothetical protein
MRIRALIMGLQSREEPRLCAHPRAEASTPATLVRRSRTSIGTGRAGMGGEGLGRLATAALAQMIAAFGTTGPGRRLRAAPGP